MCERYTETGALRQIVGVGPITSLTFILTIEDEVGLRLLARGMQLGDGHDSVLPDSNSRRSRPT